MIVLTNHAQNVPSVVLHAPISTAMNANLATLTHEAWMELQLNFSVPRALTTASLVLQHPTNA